MPGTRVRQPITGSGIVGPRTDEFPAWRQSNQ
jgi:hypothetical protein